MREDRESLARKLAEYQRMAETRLQQFRQRHENLVQEGAQRQAVLQQERNQLQVPDQHLFCTDSDTVFKSV